MPLWALALLFLLVPIAELYLIYQVGDAIGRLDVPPARGRLPARLGAAAIAGPSVWRRFNDNLAQGRLPHREVIDGVLVIFGGAFLITPGFLTDIVGLALLPPTRADRAALSGAPARPARVAGGAATGARLRRRGQRARGPRAPPPGLER